MVKLTSKKGVTKEFALNFDKVCDYERSHPNWSIMKEFEQVGNIRFSSLDLLASMVGADGWKKFASDGFTAEDLAEIIRVGLEELGFTSQDQDSESVA